MLELEVLRRASIMRASSALDDLVGVAVEERQQIVDEQRRRPVWSISPTHGPGALLDVEQQARPAEAGVMGELVLAARADRERAQQQVERLADRVGVAVGAEVAHALLLGAPHDHGPGPLFVERHREERVALVVDQADVEPRPVLLDQVEYSSISASSSLRTWIHSTVAAVVTICAVRGGR